MGQVEVKKLTLLLPAAIDTAKKYYDSIKEEVWM